MIYLSNYICFLYKSCVRISAHRTTFTIVWHNLEKLKLNIYLIGETLLCWEMAQNNASKNIFLERVMGTVPLQSFSFITEESY
jgi:hypothetical protein